MNNNFVSLSKGFRMTFLTEEHKKWANDVYSRLPKKVRKLVDKKQVIINYSPKNYPDKDEIAYFIKPSLIEFNTKHLSSLIRKEIFIGSLAHELGHFYANNLNPIFRFIHLKRFRKLSKHKQEEMLANYLASKMGFEKEIKIVEGFNKNGN